MKQQPSSFHVICAFCQQNIFSIPISVFIVIPPEVCVQDKWSSQWGSSAGHGPTPHSRERLTRANGSKAVSTPELPGPKDTSQPPPAASCMDKWAVLVPCHSRPSCVDVESPFPRSYNSSIAGSTRLACHSTCHLTLKAETLEGQSEIQAETWARPHHPLAAFEQCLHCAGQPGLLQAGHGFSMCSLIPLLQTKWLERTGFVATTSRFQPWLLLPNSPFERATAPF